MPSQGDNGLSALKAVEASVAAALADLRFGSYQRDISLDIERATCSSFPLIFLGSMA